MEPLLTLRDLAARWGIAYNTVNQRKFQGKLPEPDVTVERSPAWFVSTIEKYEEDNHGVGSGSA
jgi:hypothetical protein